MPCNSPVPFVASQVKLGMRDQFQLLGRLVPGRDGKIRGKEGSAGWGRLQLTVHQDEHQPLCYKICKGLYHELNTELTFQAMSSEGTASGKEDSGSSCSNSDDESISALST
mgnify:CR=1 FL=1